MAIFYLDSSALAKRFKLSEPGTAFVDRVFELLAVPDHTGVSSYFTYLEILALACRLRKGKQLTAQSMELWLAKMNEDFVKLITPVPLTSEIIHSLNVAIMEHALKTPDAIQLQSARLFSKHLRVRPSQIAFVTCDNDLAEAAKKERFQIISPMQKDAIQRLDELLSRM